MIGYENGKPVVQSLDNRQGTVLFLRENTPGSGANDEGDANEGSEQNQNAGGEAEEGEGFDMGSLSDNDFFVDADGKKMTVKESREAKAENERLKAQLAAFKAGKPDGSEQPDKGGKATGANGQTDMMKELVRREAAREIEKHLKEFPLLDPEDVFEAIKTSSKPVLLPEIKIFMKEVHDGLEKRLAAKNQKYLDFKSGKTTSSSSAEDLNETGKGSQTPKMDKNKINLTSIDSIGAAFDTMFGNKT